MAKSKYTSSSSDSADDINITPLMDITFIMLIFFIVTSTFVKEPGVKVDRPEAQTATTRKFASILIAITADNKVWIDKKNIDLNAVRATVEQMRAENPKGTAVVQVDKDADTRYLVEVVEQVRQAGITDVAVSTLDKSS
ncbi:MAG: biopolymer transporter ExbD [Alphaproteobacteria bacterium]|nr:biopolymer transporter ExbD [Alphaproteobacteria bacterium]